MPSEALTTDDMDADRQRPIAPPTQLPPVPVKAGQIVDYTPPSAPATRVYKFRVPGLGARAAFTQHLLTMCGEYPQDDFLLRVVRRIVRAVKTGEDRDEALTALAAGLPYALGMEKAEPGSAEEDLVTRINELGAWAQRIDTGYAQLISARRYYIDMMPLIALRHFLDDWHFDPRLAVRPCEIETVGLWFSCGGRDGLRHLPQAGGLLDQAAVMIDAFNIIAAAVAAHDPKKAE